MKIIHCADLHLDARMTANLTEDQAKVRRAELLHTFLRMTDYAQDNQVEAILIAGDLYDAVRVSATASNTVRDTVQSHPQIDFYYLRGNHDPEGFPAKGEELPDNLKLFSDVWTTYIANPKGRGNITISGVELPRENGAGVCRLLVLPRDKFNIVVLHGQETGYTGKDKTGEVPLKELRDKGIDYLALGHVHSYKEAPLDARGVYCYCGCLEGRGFDECGEHGFVLLDIDEENLTYTRSFIPIARRCLYAPEVNVSGCMTTAEFRQKIQEVLEQKKYEKDSLVKVVLTGELDVECEKNLELLRQQFAGDYYVFQLSDKTRLRVDYQAFSMDRSLKGEFVRTVMAKTDLEEEERLAIIRYGIQVLSGEEMDSYETDQLSY